MIVVLAGIFLVLPSVYSSNVNAALVIGSFGDYGYTYNIVWPSPTSQYNVMGEIKYGSLGWYGTSRFQTYASRQSGATVSNFQSLKLRGRIWSQNATFPCPLYLWDEQKKHWQPPHTPVTGAKDAWILALYKPDPDVFETYSIGKHKIVHPDTKSDSTGLDPKAFYVWNDDAANPATKDLWVGKGLGCTQSPIGLPTDDPDDD